MRRQFGRDITYSEHFFYRLGVKMTFWTPERLLKMVIFVCFLLVGALTIIFIQQAAFNDRINDLREAQVDFTGIQEENRTRNREVKGIVCRIEYALGLESNPVCVTPDLLENYWSPDDSVSPFFQRVDRE